MLWRAVLLYCIVCQFINDEPVSGSLTWNSPVSGGLMQNSSSSWMMCTGRGRRGWGGGGADEGGGGGSYRFPFNYPNRPGIFNSACLYKFKEAAGAAQPNILMFDQFGEDFIVDIQLNLIN